MMPRLTFFILLFMMAACSELASPNLEQLGSEASFSDVEIPDDFPAPEDEPETIEEDVPIEVTPPPVQVSLKNTFYIDDSSFQLARGPAVRWDGCVTSKASQGGYNSDSQCGRAFFHPSFANNLNESFFACVDQAAQAAELPAPRWIFVRHLGSYNDRLARNSNRLSHHAYARAWDIVNFNLYDEEGTLHRVSTLLRDYEGPQAVFYDQFRACWQESLPDSCGPGDREYLGSVGHQASQMGGNSLHNDHLHLAYPLCAGDS
jgi:hypothetical protein